MTREKILFPFVGDSVGGSQIASILLIKNLFKIKRDFRIITFTNNGELVKYLNEKKIPFHSLSSDNGRLKVVNLIFLLLKNLKFVLEIIKQNNIKKIHTNDLRMHYIWSIFCFIFKKNHIWHQHSAILSRKTKYLSKLSYKILTVSNFAKESFHYSMSKKAIVVGNPFENRKLVLKKQKKLKKNILYIGNNNFQKRSCFFIDLAKELFINNNNYEFHMVGDFNFKNSQIKRLSKFNINIHEKRFDLRRLFLNSDLLIAPAVNEGFGRIIVEAMLYKVLVIASNSGAHKEIITDKFNGRLIKSDSLKMFKKEIKDVLSNKKIFQYMVTNAYMVSNKKYDIGQYLNLFKKIYK